MSNPDCENELIACAMPSCVAKRAAARDSLIEAADLLKASHELLDGSVRMKVFSFDPDGLPARTAKRIRAYLRSGTACPYCTSDNEAIRSTYYDQTCEGCVKRMGRS